MEMRKQASTGLAAPMVEPELNQSLFASDGAPSRLMSQIACTIEIDLPERLSEWKRMSRSLHSFYVKKVKGAEVKWHFLSFSIQNRNRSLRRQSRLK